MSKHETELMVSLPRESALAACRVAVSNAGWQLAPGDEEVVGQEIVAPLSYHAPVTVHMTVAEATNGMTTVSIHGSNFGLGPIQSSHVKKQVQMFADAIAAMAAQPPPAPAPARGVSEQASSGPRIVINGQPLSQQAIDAAAAIGVRLSEGDFWYDAVMGAWGYRGGPTMGFVVAGLDLGGPLAADASNGNTGVFINGRQLPVQDVMALQQVVPMVWPGRYRMDAYGNAALENGFPLGNIWQLAQSSGAPKEGILSTYDKTGVAVIGY
jgi:hypothetical protein